MTDTDTTELVYQARLRASRKCLDGYAVPFDVNLDNALADTIERLTRERDEADAAAEAHEAKWQAFCKAPVDPDGAGTCACSYDQPGDVCLFHSPKLAAAEARITKLERACRFILPLLDKGGYPTEADLIRAALKVPTP